MKTTPQHSIDSFHSTHLALILTASMMLAPFAAAQAEDRYQQDVLWNPSEDILRAEAQGRIMIYDGLTDETVELALSRQFDRIENMMFVRTRLVEPDGEIVVEDDGCD